MTCKPRHVFGVSNQVRHKPDYTKWLEAWNFRFRKWEPRLDKNQRFAYAKAKTQISIAVTAKLISAFVFATWIIQYLFFLNTKFSACSHLQWLYSLVCVRPGQNPHCWFSRVAAHRWIVIIQSLPLSEGDMTICSPEARVNKSSCHPHSRATIVLLYRTTFETTHCVKNNIIRTPGQHC